VMATAEQVAVAWRMVAVVALAYPARLT